MSMNELEEQKKDLRLALAAAKLKEDLALKKEHIVFFLHQFAGMDYSDIDCQKRLIKTFLNSVFVYDDKVVLTFNYSGDDRTITLHEIDGGLGHSIRIPSAVVHQKERYTFVYLSFFLFLKQQENHRQESRECLPVQYLTAAAPYLNDTLRITFFGKISVAAKSFSSFRILDFLTIYRYNGIQIRE